MFALQERALRATGLWRRCMRCRAMPTWKSRCSAMPMAWPGARPCSLSAAAIRAWLVGAGQVWTSAQTDAAVDLAVRTYTPTKYAYEVSASGGGVLQLRHAAVGIGRRCNRGVQGCLSAGDLRRRYAVARPHFGGWGQWRPKSGMLRLAFRGGGGDVWPRPCRGAGLRCHGRAVAHAAAAGEGAAEERPRA